MKIRVISVLLAFAMTFSCTICAFADDDVEDLVTKTEESDISQNYDTIGDDIVSVESQEMISELSQKTFVAYEGYKGVMIRGKKFSTGDAAIFKKDNVFFIPIRAIAEYVGGRCEWRADTETVNITYGDYVLQIFSGKSEYLLNGKSGMLPKPAENVGNYVYISSDSVSELLDKHSFIDESLLILSDEKLQFNSEKENELQFSLLSELVFERPSKEQIWNDFVANGKENQHPRVVINQERVDFILQKTQTDERYKTWMERVIGSAEGILSTQPNNDSENSLGLARALMNRFRTLGMAYLLTKDQRFPDRAWLDIENVARFTSWHEAHYLDVAELSAAFAYAYDWMYDGFTPEQRLTMRKIVSTHSMYHSLVAYRGTGPALPSTRYGWPKYTNNWNPVCNGGVAMIAIAMLDEPDIKEQALECLEAGIKSLELNLNQFYPNGVYYESNTYFLYNTEYLAVYLSSLDSALGTNYGLADSPGLIDGFYCRMYQDSPTGMFSYGDGDESKIDVPEWSYFAKASNDPELMKRRMDILKNGGGGIKELLWFDEDFALSGSVDSLGLDACFDGTAQLGIMRNSWDDPMGLYIATRAGYGNISHSHVDVGSFYIDALGQRWTLDPGAGDYGWPEYFGNKRFDYYKTRAEGHNMVVVNPDLTGGYDMSATTDIDMISKPRGVYITLDTAKGYKRYGVSESKRAMGLIDDRTRFIVQDEFVCEKPSEFYWFMHSKADITVSEDGKKATFTIGNKHLLAELISDKGVFEVMDSVSLETSPVYEPQTYPDCKKLMVHIENETEVDISVVMTPYTEGEAIPYYTGSFSKISDWEIPDGEIPSLDSIEFDGEPFGQFDPNKAVYNIAYYDAPEKAPYVTATSSEYDVSVEQAVGVPGMAKIHLAKNGQRVKTINVNFTIKEIIGQISGRTKYLPVYADASDIPEATNGPMNLIDNDILTKWAAQESQYMQFDLGEEKNVDTVSVAWSNPTVRLTPFTVSVSTDGKTWESVYTGISRGQAVEFESYSFEEVKARYVKIELTRSSASSWHSIYEVGIYGKAE